MLVATVLGSESCHCPQLEQTVGAIRQGEPECYGSGDPHATEEDAAPVRDMSTPVAFRYLDQPHSCGQAEWDPSVDLEQVQCPITSDHRRGGKRIGPLRVILPSVQIGDFVTTWLSDWIIQDRVLTRFGEAGFTGFSVQPVEVTKVRLRRKGGKSAKGLPPLWELQVTGWAGEAPPKTGIRMSYHCEGCQHTHYTACRHPEHLIDPAQWDGSDFSIVWPLPKFVFVTERVADVIRQEGYTGVRLVRPADMGICNGNGFSPGPPPPGRTVRGPEAFPRVRIRRFRPKAR
jgi:hypothetical protein